MFENQTDEELEFAAEIYARRLADVRQERVLLDERERKTSQDWARVTRELRSRQDRREREFQLEMALPRHRVN